MTEGSLKQSDYEGMCVGDETNQLSRVSVCLPKDNKECQKILLSAAG